MVITRSYKRLYLFTALFIALYFCSKLYSQENESKYSFVSIDSENGLSNNVIYDILQDKEGYIWMATDNGLNRYNGYTIQTFFHKPTDSTTISSSVVRSLIEDSDGNFWIGTKNGLNLFDKENREFNQPIILDNTPFINKEVMKMELDPAGNIWFVTLNDVGFFNPQTLRIELVSSSEFNPYITITNKKVWIRNKEGDVSYYDLNSKILNSNKDYSILSHQLIHFDSLSKRLWIPDEFESEVANLDYSILPKLPNNLKMNSVLEIDSSNLWIGTNEGLFEYNFGSKQLRKIDLGKSTLIQQIKRIYKDNHGGVWIGTLGGVYHYDSHRKVFDHIYLDEDSDDIV
ncbi:MAG: hypothetical protein HKN48_03665, partial [Flavobacteriaceae bacterium]|nr:hypothetical protein [Flavobacteriaceae bacterium]